LLLLFFAQIIPLIPIGLPDYDIGEERYVLSVCRCIRQRWKGSPVLFLSFCRFDLRLPYVDNGWVDEDADFGKQIGRFFGLGKKKADDEDVKGGKGKAKGGKGGKK
jgi:hypothetical protein